MPDHSLRVAVIGAGPAGIAAGHELLRQGFTNITLFEKSDQQNINHYDYD